MRDKKEERRKKAAGGSAGGGAQGRQTKTKSIKDKKKGGRRKDDDWSDDEDGQVAITTTLNSAGCDKEKMQEMDIDWPDFLEQQFEIIHAYERLGIEATLSCTPYDEESN